MINIHLFKHRDFDPVPVKVTMDKMNPTVVRIAEKTITLTEEWQQEMFIHFEITESGDIIILDPIDEDLVVQKITRQGGGIQ